MDKPENDAQEQAIPVAQNRRLDAKDLAQEVKILAEYAARIRAHEEKLKAQTGK